MREQSKKIGKIILTILRVIVWMVLAAFILVVCLQRFSGNKISFFRYRMFTVVSESMAPKFKIGDVLISKEMESSKIGEGDIISYLGTKGSFQNKVITHRVLSKEKREDGKYYFRAKGDANLVEDPIIGEDQLYGVVVYKTRILSLIYKVVGTKIGFCLFIIIPIMFIIGSEMLSTLLEKEEERRKKLKKDE